MKLPAPIAIALQTAFSRYVELDPDSNARLRKLRGKVVCFQVEGVDLPIWFIFNEVGADETSVEVVEDFGDSADATIAGGPFSLLALATGRRSIFDGDVKISGDTDTAQKFSRCLNEIDIDWEEHLSRLTGDAVAHQIGRFSSGLKQWFTERTDAVQANTADYLRDETEHLPHSWELDEFVEQVDDLRDRVESLELQINSTKSTAKNSAKISGGKTI